jgi:hypothetical protein
MVNFMSESSYKKSERKSTNLETEDTDEREIVALETSQVKDAHSDLDQEKESKGKNLSRALDHDFDNKILGALSMSERACIINLSIYALITGFGATLLAYSLIYSVFNGIEIGRAHV